MEIATSAFGRKVWNSTDEKLRRLIWRYNKKYVVRGEKGCENKHIDDSDIYQAFVNTFNVMIKNKDYFMEVWKDNLKSENNLLRYNTKQLIKIIENVEPIEAFDIDLFFRIIEKMIVFEGNKIIVTLLEGTAIEMKFNK